MRETAARGRKALLIIDFATEYAARRLIHRSVDLQDSGQVEELAQLFSQGEIIVGGLGHVYVGVAGVRDLLRRQLFFDANGLPADPATVYATTRALHYLSNVDIYLDSNGAVAATSRFLIVQLRDRVPRIVIGGRYSDSFAVGEEGLHFRRRIVEAHIVGDTEGYLMSNPWTA